MKTTYSNFKINIHDEYGDEYVSFSIYAHQGSEIALINLTLHFLRRYLQKNYPEEEKNISNVRNSLAGYGPKEKEVLETLIQEEFPFEKYVILYIESRATLVAEEIMRQKKLQNNPIMQLQLEQKLQELEELIPSRPIKTSQFLDELEKAILKHLIDNYPELINAEPEDIRKLQVILVNFIPDFGIKLINHIEDIRGRI
jgi:hypothetical protein